jgi:hypothetical protein
MSLTKKLILALLIIVIIIQFIRPTWNRSDLTFPEDISSVIKVPDSIKVILHKACYNCHSNNTDYPWYSYVEPVGWFLAGHIKHARENLNFNEFGKYSERRQASKLDGIADEIRDNGMPLPSYRIFHKDARLSKTEKKLLIDWAYRSENSLSVGN